MSGPPDGNSSKPPHSASFSDWLARQPDKAADNYGEAVHLEQQTYHDWLTLKMQDSDAWEALRDAAQAWAEAQAVVLTLFRDEVRRSSRACIAQVGS